MEQNDPLNVGYDVGSAPVPASPVLNYRDAGVAMDVPCPLCGYYLREQSEPCCPACGYTFDWQNLLDPARRAHLYLFEFHPRHNVWSFCRTLIGGLRPWRFWSVLRPDQESRPHRLLLYWVLTVGVSLAGAVGLYVGMSFAAGDSLGDTFEAIGPYFVLWWLWGLLWPWLTFLTLMIFRASMRRARVKPIHVLRCVLYSADAALWPAVAGALAAGVIAGLVMTNVIHRWRWAWYVERAWYDNFGWWNLVFLAGLVFAAVKLAAAYRKYLKFDHAVATAVAAQVIVVLFVIVASANLFILFGPHAG